MAYNDIIDTGKLVPWGNGLNSLLTSQHVLGLKQYELTNQLGNVQATVSDKRFVKTNGNGARDYFNAGIVASYDYYPYGQLMPDRWGNDTSTICVTTSQIQMLPRKIMTSVPLTKVTFDTSRYTGYARPVPWPRTLTLGPDGVTTDDYRRGVMVVLDVTPGVPIDVSVELGKFYAPNHMFNTWEYHPSGVGGIRNFWTTSWWWLPGVQTHTCTPLTDKIYLSVYSNWWNYTMGDLGQFPNFTIKSINYEKVVYEPQSVLVQLCNKAEDKYEFGYNTQMKVNEVAGIGNWNTAEYWEYATRSGHRANIDPVKRPWESPYTTFGANPILNNDVNGDDWYKDKKSGTIQYDPKVQSQKDLNKGQKYIGDVYEEKQRGKVNYRQDGSIKFANETDAYSRIWSNTKMRQREEMAVIQNNGVLVLPSYNNYYNESKIEDYGYRFTNDKLYDPVSKTNSAFLGTIHVHPGGTGFSGVEGDIGYFPKNTPNKPAFVWQQDDRMYLSAIVGIWDKKKNDPRYFFLHSKDFSNVEGKDLLNGKSLIKALKAGYPKYQTK